MGIRDHGYYGYAFVGARPAQFVALIAVIGMVGNFISEIVHTGLHAPGELVGTIVIACLAVFWTIISFTAYDDTHIPYLATCGVDALFLVPFIVVAAVLGGPLSVTTCSALPREAPTNETTYLALPVSGAGQSSGTASYVLFAGAAQATCYELMAVWGLIIALCVLFAISAFATGLQFLGRRRAARAEAGGSGVEMALPKDFSDAGSLRDIPAPPGFTTRSSPASGFGSPPPPVPPLPSGMQGGRRAPPPMPLGIHQPGDIAPQ